MRREHTREVVSCALVVLGFRVCSRRPRASKPLIFFSSGGLLFCVRARVEPPCLYSVRVYLGFSSRKPSGGILLFCKCFFEELFGRGAKKRRGY